MGLNDTPSSQRVHIGFFGKRNAGKSSVVNAVTGQDLAVVSAVKGTTTDPVYKAMELLPMGPVMIIDTPGFDDEGALGELRVRKTRQVLNKTDHAAGKGARYTRSHPPVKLLGSIAFPDRSSASKAEYGVKQLSAIEKRRLVATLQPDAASQKAPVVAEPDSCA